MKYPDEPPLTDQDRRAIAEIRRQLDRELGPPFPEPGAISGDLAAVGGPAAARGRGKGLRLALGAGAVTLAAAVIGAFVSLVDLIGPSARSPIVASPPGPNAISIPPLDPAPPLAGETNAREVAGTKRRAMAKSPQRGVPRVARAATRPAGCPPPPPQASCAALSPVDDGPPGRGEIGSQYQRAIASSVSRDRDGAAVRVMPARSVPLASIQSP
jgi:hypothetical protein